MENPEKDVKHVSSKQMVVILDSLLEISDIMVDYHALFELDSERLLQKTSDGLGCYGLELSDSAKLLGVTESTVKRWQRSKDLTANAKQKIAALCLLLSCAKKEEYVNMPAINLVFQAISKLQGKDCLKHGQSNYSEQSLSSVFGPSGLMAAAWYLAINPTNTHSDTDIEK